MKKILIPTDFSENSINAIEYALEYYKNMLVTFYLLHVSNENLPETSSNKINEQLEFELDRCLKLSQNANHTFYGIYENLSLIEGIRKHVNEREIDYIVMGTKGGSASDSVTIGSNTSEVITKIKCPILVVPRKAKYSGIHNIAFPTDYNCIFKNKVLTTIYDTLHGQKAAIHVLNVKSASHKLSEDQHNNKSFLKDMLKETNHSFHSLESQTIEKGIQEYVDNQDIDMIAMVAKNVNIIQRLLFKPKDFSVNYRIELPFLVIHE